MKKIGNNTRVYVKEAYYQSRKRILAFIGFLVAAWGVVNSLVSLDLGWKIVSGMAVIGVIYASCVYLKWLYKIMKGRMSNTILVKRKVTLLRNGFPENMDILLNELPLSELQNFAFIMGFDRSGLLNISTKVGVIHAVLNYLDEKYLCEEELPSKKAQQQLTEYKESHGLDKGFEYGTCVEIRLKLSPKDCPQDYSKTIPCNLILVANSRKVNYSDITYAETVDDDNSSNIIVPNIFEYLLKTNHFTGAMIGVMGTNGMRQSYQVVFSQTINQYARICYKDEKNPLVNLYISIRETDYYNKWGVSLSQLSNYVRTCANYY